MDANHEEHMREAIELSIESVNEGGGPFGAVVVDRTNNTVIGRGKNRVMLHHDPTAHGEIVAMRDAAKSTNRKDLTGCVLYTSAEPCPACLTATLFNAPITDIYYGNSAEDAASVGFADDKNWQMLRTTAIEMVEKVGGHMEQILRNEAQAGFDAWTKKKDKLTYYQT